MEYKKKSLATLVEAMDGYKRLEGHITELAFQKAYCQKRLSDEASYGWMQSVHDDDFDYDWYLCLDNLNNVPSSVGALFDKLNGKGSHCFYIVSSPDYDSITSTLYFEVHIISQSGEGYELERVPDLEQKILRIINAKIQAMDLSGAMGELEDYLHFIHGNELIRLLVSRCLMNFALKIPRDIDAVDMDDAGDITFIEFKRKDAADSYYVRNGFLPITQYGKYFRSINEKIHDGAARGDVHRVLVDDFHAKHTLEECFGLDYYSHVKNVILCYFNNIKYLYVIWERSPKNNIASLVNKDLSLAGSTKGREVLVGLGSFSGFNYTVDEDRGSIHQRYSKSDKPRYQMMIPIGRFSPVDIASPSSLGSP